MKDIYCLVMKRKFVYGVKQEPKQWYVWAKSISTFLPDKRSNGSTPRYTMVGFNVTAHPRAFKVIARFYWLDAMAYFGSYT